MGWFISFGYTLYIQQKKRIRIANIFIASYPLQKLGKHYELIRSFRLNRLINKLQVSTPLTPHDATRFSHTETDSTTQLLHKGKRPNKLKQLAWNIVIFQQYVDFTQHALSTTNGKTQLVFIDKETQSTNEIETFIKNSKFSKSSEKIILSMLKIYDVLDSTTFRNHDIQLSMIQLIREAQEQSTQDSVSDQEINVHLEPNLPQTQTNLKLSNDCHQDQIVLEFSEQIENEIVLLITILYNDYELISNTTHFPQRLTIAYRLIIIKFNLSWIINNPSSNKINTKINQLVHGFITKRKI